LTRGRGRFFLKRDFVPLKLPIILEASPLFNSPLIKGCSNLSGCLRGADAPLFPFFPLSLKGEGDKGGEVNKVNKNPQLNSQVE
jgi:hypothetical protein